MTFEVLRFLICITSPYSRSIYLCIVSTTTKIFISYWSTIDHY